ncbi:hypothetical protein DFH09DRAFT_1105726 [Mycena vulgaris]|nr:hypothetical protein DFH09DRAFT_1105726 [Mycena vulgaris]
MWQWKERKRSVGFGSEAKKLVIPAEKMRKLKPVFARTVKPSDPEGLRGAFMKAFRIFGRISRRSEGLQISRNTSYYKNYCKAYIKNQMCRWLTSPSARVIEEGELLMQALAEELEDDVPDDGAIEIDSEDETHIAMPSNGLKSYVKTSESYYNIQQTDFNAETIFILEQSSAPPSRGHVVPNLDTVVASKSSRQFAMVVVSLFCSTDMWRRFPRAIFSEVEGKKSQKNGHSIPSWTSKSSIEPKRYLEGISGARKNRNRPVHGAIDGWTSPLGTNYLGIVISWTDGGKIHRAVLEFIKLTESHTDGKYLAKVCADCLERFGLAGLIVHMYLLNMDTAGNCDTTAELKTIIPTFGGAAARLRCLFLKELKHKKVVKVGKGRTGTRGQPTARLAAQEKAVAKEGDDLTPA